MQDNLDQRLLAWAEEEASLLPDLPPLGLDYNSQRTVFRLYAPAAEEVKLLLYPLPCSMPQQSQEDYLNSALESSDYQSFLENPSTENFHHVLMLLRDYSNLSKVQTEPEEHYLERDDSGLWTLSLERELFAWRYNYELKFSTGQRVLSQDPYAKVIAANGQYGVIADPYKLNLLAKLTNEACAAVKQPLDFRHNLEAIIYESHVRDFTIRPNTNFEYPGTFLGWTERGIKNSNSQPAGLDHVLELGVSHVQFLPIYKTATLDEAGSQDFNAQYNWGYDPAHYFAVEGFYSTKPADPFRRILELKFLSRKLRNEGLKMIMDVVFNHVYDYKTHPLELCTPGLCFRLDERGEMHNGSFCGNETKSESPYFRRYMLDCLSYWAENFELSGFRFDLMGLHDLLTMQLVRRKLSEIDPKIIILGEGWIMGNHPPEVPAANEQNASLMPGIAFFNDSFRDLLRGNNYHSDFSSLLSGTAEAEASWNVYNSICGGRFIKDFGGPEQNVLYLECHDNHSLYDLLKLRAPDLSEDELKRRLALGFFTQSLGHGILFIHSGQEFGRSKEGLDNSYNAPDEINALDWERLSEFSLLKEKFKELIRLRKERDCLKIADPWLLAEKYELIVADRERLIYSCDFRQKELCLLNFSQEDWILTVPEGYKLLASTEFSEGLSFSEAETALKLELPAFSGALLVLQEGLEC